MIKLIVFSIAGLVLLSCNEEEKFNKEQYPQKWQLVKTIGNVPNSETIGEDMEWQEFYVFNTDGTFTKSRDRKGILNTASGNFEFSNVPPDGDFFELTFNTGNNIIGGCYAKPCETLWQQSPSKLVSTWLNCDGPGLEYTRIF